MLAPNEAAQAEQPAIRFAKDQLKSFVERIYGNGDYGYGDYGYGYGYGGAACEVVQVRRALPSGRLVRRNIERCY